MNVFTIFAAIAMVVIVLATPVAFICVLWFGRKKSRAFRVVRLGLCCLPAAILMGVFGWIFGPWDISDPEELRSAYEHEFGEYPTADVTMIQCRQVVVGDSGAAWLAFQASPETTERIVKKFTPSNFSIFSTSGSGGNCPSWWQPETAKLVQYYKAEHWSPHFRVSEAFIGHDREKRTVYFYHSGFD